MMNIDELTVKVSESGVVMSAVTKNGTYYTPTYEFSSTRHVGLCFSRCFNDLVKRIGNPTFLLDSEPDMKLIDLIKILKSHEYIIKSVITSDEDVEVVLIKTENASVCTKFIDNLLNRLDKE